MASKGSQYPGYLNPFGDVEDEDEQGDLKPSIVVSVNEYPDHLDPFGENNESAPALDEYDDSLNPFGDEALPETNEATTTGNSKSQSLNTIQGALKLSEFIRDDGNPFADEDDHVEESTRTNEPKSIQDKSIESRKSPSPDLTEPPKPLPRTKSLLKKEQAHKKRLQEQQVLNMEQANSLQSTTSSTTSSSSTTTDMNPSLATVGSFQRRKRLAPPVPINFKRQVSGSLDAIEKELDGIGDKLAIVDKESTLCQETLTLKDDQVDEADIKSTRSKFAELIKRRNSIVRRQKELMYKKRELKLDQLHSDIEYELRMIGNKQLSTRTEEDEIKEKELLKKLVEIVEEKNDIVENLNKDTSCDSRDVQEAFRRLNIAEYPPENLVVDEKHNNNISKTVGSSTVITRTTTTTKILSKRDSCDKRGLAKLSKIATLLPKSNTIKLKRKRLFKKDTSDSQPVESVFSSPRQDEKQQRAGGQPISTGGPSQSSAMSRESTKQMSGPNVFQAVHVPRATFSTLILGCIVFSLLLQCNEGKQLDFDLSQEGKPCICNSTFFRSCPPADTCLENNIPDATPSPKPADPRDNYLDREAWGFGALTPALHDDFDPDHVSDPWQAQNYGRLNLRPDIRADYSAQNLRLDYDSSGRIVRHRKVYLKPRALNNSPNVIHALNIRIPVKAPIIDEPVMPAPKPLFKMKKYITYERKPEIVQMPVTKTIIRPVGVTPDQIIQDDSLPIASPNQAIPYYYYTFVFAKHYAHVSNAEFGILASLFPALALVAKPISCAVTDAMGIHRKFLISSLAVFGLSYGSLGFVALLKDPNSYENDRLCWFVIAALLTVGYIANACIYCMNDALASNYARKHNLSYSRMRFWACLGWAVGALVVMFIGDVSWLPVRLPGIIILFVSITVDILILMLWPYGEDFEMFHDGSTIDQRKLSMVGPNTMAYLSQQDARRGSFSDVIDAIKTGRSKSVGYLQRPETIKHLEIYDITRPMVKERPKEEEKEYSNFQCQMILIKMIATAHRSFLRYIALFIIFGIATGMIITYNFDYFKAEIARDNEEFEFMSQFSLIMQSIGEAPINLFAQDLIRLFGSNACVSLAFVALGLRSFSYGRLLPYLGSTWVGLGETLQGLSSGFYWVLIVDIGSNYALMVPDFMPEMKRRGIVRDRVHEEELNGCLRATMIGVMSSSMEGLGMAIGALLGGFITSSLSYVFMWDLCAFIAITTGFINLAWEVGSKLLLKRERKKPDCDPTASNH